MRTMTVLALAFFVACVCPAAQAGKKQLKVQISKQDVDLVNRTLHFTLNRPADNAVLAVYDLDGELLAERMEHYDGAPAGTKLSISWPTIIDSEENFLIELKVTDTSEYWVGWQIVRFYGEIPHEEVIFESGKWEIRPSEAPKLDAALPAILEMIEKFKKFGKGMDYGLYIAGHTDTVGSLADNRELSRRRARAIAEYFIEHGLKKKKISISVRGFGEEVQAIDTEDSVDEERNRRADYIISNFPPELPGPGGWVRVK